MTREQLYQLANRTLLHSQIGQLYGFEPRKSEEIVTEYARRFRNNPSFPPVEIVPYKDGFRIAYKMMPGTNRIDGGHYRSLGALNAGIPLPVIITQDNAEVFVEEYLYPLLDTQLVSAENDVRGFFASDREERLTCPLLKELRK